MKHFEIVGTVLAVSMLLAGITGCQKQEGPMEQAGRDADRAVEKVGQQIEKAGEKLQDASKRDKP